MEGNSKITLRIPAQDLEEFTLFSPNALSAQDWAQALPVTNTDAVVEMISQALGDLNRVKLTPQARYDILETLLPSLEVAVSNLTKRFLNQPLIMPAGPQKMAELAARLHTMASTAYTIVAVETIQKRDSIHDINPALLTCQAIQRALIYAGRKVLQTYQLFRPLEIHGWRSLHQLYALAESQGLAALPIPESRSGANTVRDTYLQAVLLGCCKPNHLRQADLTALYASLQHWSDQVELQTSDGLDGLFLVDLQSDQPPLYRSLYKDQPGAQCRAIDTHRLVAHLEALKPEAEKKPLKIAEGITLPGGILEHLINSLGRMSLRNFKRTSTIGELSICIGLRSVHYHVSGECSFPEVLHGRGYVPAESDDSATNPFLQKHKSDVWQTANPREYYVDENEHLPIEILGDQGIDINAEDRAAVLIDEEAGADKVEPYSLYTAQLTDVSPGGYCFEWNADMPNDIRSGDIVGLKESGGKEWVIAVIRWFGRFDDARTLIGLELLSPRAMSYGASIHQKSGEMTPPIRVLLLPEIKLVGQPNTLITPRAGFRERQKVTLKNESEERSVQLLRLLSATGSFAQFEYQDAKSLGDILSESDDVKLGTDPDSLWSNI